MPKNIHCLTRGKTLAAALLACAGLIPASCAAGNDSDVFHAGVLASETSDDYQQREAFFSYRSQPRAHLWPWVESSHSGWDWGLALARTQGEARLEYQGARVEGLLGRRLASWAYVEARAGRHQLDVDDAEIDRTITPWGVLARLEPHSSLGLRLSTEEDFAYRDGLLSAAITQGLRLRTHRAHAQWRPHERLRLNSNFGYRAISDGNIARQADAAAIYGISPAWPWIWAGVAASRLEFAEPRDDYWTPDRHTSYGLRFESSFPLNGQLSATASASLNRVREEDRDWGTGQYAALGLQGKLTENIQWVLQASRINSRQSGSSWHENSYLLSLRGSLF